MSTTLPTVTVCRGCCCGTRKKHPDVDHDAQLDELRDSVRDVARVRTSDCLDDCKRSNVMVVSPSRAARAEGGRPVWLQKVLTTSVMHEIGDWIRAGGPGVVSAPPEVQRYVYRPGASTKKAVAKVEKKAGKKKKKG
ncbi:MAG: (2Fe-2S) ferredoxin domain-containing protein [Gordonia paraffinivorans]